MCPSCMRRKRSRTEKCPCAKCFVRTGAFHALVQAQIEVPSHQRLGAALTQVVAGQNGTGVFLRIAAALAQLGTDLLFFKDPVRDAGALHGVPGVPVGDVGRYTAVIVNIGVPDLDTLLVDLFYHDVVPLRGPVAFHLTGNQGISILQGGQGHVRVEDLVPEIVAHIGGFSAEDRVIRSPVAAIGAVALTQNGRSQLRIRHVAGEHGEAGNAAAIGPQGIVAVAGDAVVLL